MTDSTRAVTGGIDTHKDVHVAAALDAIGRVLGTASFPTTTAGHRRLLRWLRRFGEVRAVGIEGTGAWGAGLARFLSSAGVQVVEVQRPSAPSPSRQDRPGRCDRRGKSSAGR